MESISNSAVVFHFENEVSRILDSCPSEAVFLAAVSGGADSTAMLCALSVLVPGDRLFCLHVEHGLREPGESCGDAAFVNDFCMKLGIPCRIEIIERGKIAAFAKRRKTGIEAAARYFRRKSLIKEAKRISSGNLKKTFILTAHTRDDAEELILMRVLRGAGPAGLAAMPARRRRFLRPLLSHSRADVIAYLKEKKLSWREDSTNTDVKFIRNKIRCNLVPLLNEFFPFWNKGVLGMGETQKHAAKFIAEEAAARVKWENAGEYFFTDAVNFLKQPLIIREEAVFLCIDSLLKNVKNLRTVKRSVVRKFCACPENTFSLGHARILRKGDKIIISCIKKEFFECGISRLIKKPPLYNLNNTEKNDEEGGVDV
ncbi:MAG: tRNA lysidine(34) synthetase TilS [Treponema sp.]|nr:tRNA lysidine(34) synthetase TilS [Treponema sp.]MCL2272615.1 tRNA lysidine(34) synthetase TilS [Treponema sp.]